MILNFLLLVFLFTEVLFVALINASFGQLVYRFITSIILCWALLALNNHWLAELNFQLIALIFFILLIRKWNTDE